MKFVLYKDGKVKFEIGERDVEHFSRTKFFKEVYNNKEVYVDEEVYEKIVDCAKLIEGMKVVVSPEEQWNHRGNYQPSILVYNNKTYVLEGTYYSGSSGYGYHEGFLETVEALRDIFLEVTYDGSLYENVRY